MRCDYAVELPACDHQADGQKPLFQFSVPLLLTGRLGQCPQGQGQRTLKC
jgi:hypothetical protein